MMNYAFRLSRLVPRLIAPRLISPQVITPARFLASKGGCKPAKPKGFKREKEVSSKCELKGACIDDCAASKYCAKVAQVKETKCKDTLEDQCKGKKGCTGGSKGKNVEACRPIYKTPEEDPAGLRKKTPGPDCGGDACKKASGISIGGFRCFSNFTVIREACGCPPKKSSGGDKKPKCPSKPKCGGDKKPKCGGEKKSKCGGDKKKSKCGGDKKPKCPSKPKCGGDKKPKCPSKPKCGGDKKPKCPSKPKCGGDKKPKCGGDSKPKCGGDKKSKCDGDSKPKKIC